jgi:integrase
MHGQGRIFKRGDIWWMAFYLNGKEHRESTECTDEKEAGKVLSDRLDERGAAKIGARNFVTQKARRITVRQLCEALRKKYELNGKDSPQNLSHLKRVETDFGDYRALDLASEVIDEYIERRKAEGNAKATINRTTGMLLQAYRHGVTQKHFSEFNIPAITHLDESDNVRDDIFTETEVAAVIENLPEDLRDFTRWCSVTGMRCGEAKLLTWKMVQGNTLQIPANITKGNKARALPVDVPALAEIIARRRKLQTVEVNGTAQMCPLIFHRGGLPVGDFKKSWATATTAAKCPGRLFHSLRRFAVTNLINAGVPIPVCKLWSGHETDSMLIRYAILNTEVMKREAAKVEEYRRVVAASEKEKVVAMR